MGKGIELGQISVPDLGVEQIVGNFDGEEKSFAIVVSRFNQELTAQLAENAVAALKKYGVADEEITVVWVPGAYELPAAAARLAALEKYDGIIGLGVVVQGATQHAQLINEHIAQALGRLSLEWDLPVIYEVISANSMADAQARCEGKEDSRGWYAGLAALEMANVFEKIG